jgi:hypothetical protein
MNGGAPRGVGGRSSAERWAAVHCGGALGGVPNSAPDEDLRDRQWTRRSGLVIAVNDHLYGSARGDKVRADAFASVRIVKSKLGHRRIAEIPSDGYSSATGAGDNVWVAPSAETSTTASP